MNNNNKTLNSSLNRRKRNNKPKSEKLTIYRENGRFAPDVLKVNLVYQDPTASRTVVSSQSMNWGFRSSAYDPDPAILSGSIPGFVELANLYSQYCVHAMILDLEVANQENNAIIMVSWPSNILHNVNSLSSADLAEFSGNVRARSVIIGATNGMSRNRIKILAAGNQLVGDRFRTDLTYSSSTSTNPANTFAINIGAYSPIANFSFPIVVKSRIVYKIEFFRLRQLET